MQNIGKHWNRETFYIQFDELTEDKLPTSNWVCFAIANEPVNEKSFKQFVRICVEKDLFEFKGFGKFGEVLHLDFDLEMVEMEVNEEHSEIEIMTTDLANALWECYGATCLPDKADYDNIKIVCVNFDKHNYSMKLTDLIKRFNRNWLPKDDDIIKYDQDQNLQITLTKNEALVLFEFLSRFNEIDRKELFEDQAEEKILWNLEGTLQKELSEPFRADYLEIISKARNEIRDDIE
jgi:hypothetical protein